MTPTTEPFVVTMPIRRLPASHIPLGQVCFSEASTMRAVRERRQSSDGSYTTPQVIGMPNGSSSTFAEGAGVESCGTGGIFSV